MRIFHQPTRGLEDLDTAIDKLAGDLLEVTGQMACWNRIWIFQRQSGDLYEARLSWTQLEGVSKHAAGDWALHAGSLPSDVVEFPILRGSETWGLLIAEPESMEPVQARRQLLGTSLISEFSQQMDALYRQAQVGSRELNEEEMRFLVHKKLKFSVDGCDCEGAFLEYVAQQMNTAGVALIFREQIFRSGKCPNPSTLSEVARAIQERSRKSLFHSTDASYDLGLELGAKYAGLLALPLNRREQVMVLFFRPAWENPNNWLGEPPLSFACQGALPWEAHDLEQASRLKLILLEQLVDSNVDEKSHFMESSRRMFSEVRQLSEVASKTASGVFIANRNLEIVWCNPSLSRLTGYDMATLKGQQPCFFLNNDDQLRPEVLLAEVEAKQSVVCECRLIPKEDSPMWVKMELTLNGVDDEHHFICMLTDIDKVKRAEQEISMKNRILHQTNARLRQSRENAEFLASQARIAAEAKTKFLSTISHEILTPLNGVVGMGSLLRETSLDLEQTDCVQTILECGNSLTELIQEILDYAKLETGGFKLNESAVELESLITRAVKTVRIHAVEKDVSLEFHIDEKIPKVFVADKQRIHQVLTNLLSNAVKFTNQGTILVRIYGHCLLENIYNLTFSVKDTGIGIPPEQQKSIFDIFTQVDNSNTRKFGGAGLGLSICKKIVSAMGGEIRVTSRPGHGSEFYFSLQCKASEAEQVIPEPDEQLATTEHVPNKDLRILLVEDNAINREVALKVLQSLGYNADQALDGQMGVEMFRERGYDLVFMDLQMPIMDGFEATRNIRSLCGRSDKPWICALTANVLPENRVMAFESGVNEFLPKPIEPNAIQACIDKVVTDDSGDVAVNG